MKKQLKGRKLEDIIIGVQDSNRDCAAWEAEFLADPNKFAAEHGLLLGEAGRLRRWLAKDPCFLCSSRRAVCPYPRLCAEHRQAKKDREIFDAECERLTAGMACTSLGTFAREVLDEGAVVAKTGDQSLSEHTSLITGNRAFVAVYDDCDATYVTLYADAETVAATEQAQREHAERMRAEWDAERASQYRVRVDCGTA